LEADFLGEGVKLAELFLLGGRLAWEALALVVSGATCDQGVEHADKLVTDGGDAFGSAESASHLAAIREAESVHAWSSGGQ
jgi:hypothetical protein